MKGISPLVAAVLLIAITVGISTLLSSWLSTTSSDTASKLRNNTNVQLQCQYADLYVKNATYNCGNNCTTGTQHTAQITVVNSGKKTLSFDRFFIRNTSGDVTQLLLNETKTLNVADALTVSNTTRATCSGINNSIEIITVTSMECPATAYDSLDGADVTFNSC